MPSKKNKPRSLTTDCSPGSRYSATPRREQDTVAAKEPYRRLLSAAAARFPHLISESALCGIISDTEAFHKGNHAIIWLSQEAMVSSSLLSGSFVSVSLGALGKQDLDQYPLINFVENCIAHFGIDVGNEFLSKIGCYFAIAKIFPSTKVQKDGVILSRGLYCTMGFPAIGQALFIFPVGDISSCQNPSGGNSTSHLHLHKCKDLHLNLLPVAFRDRLPTSNTSMESTPISQKPESPNTPSHNSKLSTPAITPHQLREVDGSSLRVKSSACLDVSSLKLALVDKKMKLLLETCASYWLSGRVLLHGNFVTVPICDSQIGLFSVDSTDDLTRCFSQDLIFEEKNNMILNGASIDNSFNRKYAGLCVKETETKLSISVPVSTAGDNSSERVFPEGHESGYVIDKEPSDLTRLGGLFKEFAALEEIIKFSLENKDPLLRYTGVLLHGPPGTGKTTLASCCVRDAGARLFLISGPEIISEYYGESEQALQRIFDSAKRAAPAVVFIDELDAIAPARKGGGEALSLRMVATLLKLMDDIESSDGILVIAATNRPDSIDPALRRPGRLDREIEIGVPSPAQRLDILHTLLKHMDHSLSNTDLESLAFATHGFVGADLAALCNEAAMTALRRLIRFETSERHLNESHSKSCAVNKDMQDNIVQKFGEASYHDDLNSLSSSLSELTILPRPFCSHCFQRIPDSNVEYCSCASHGKEQKVLLEVTAEDFAVAKMKVRPSAMREVMLELPKVTWDDVGGQRETKKQLIEAIQWPQVHPDAFNRIGIHPPRGLLMIGPPGCSKTLMARAIASEAKLNFLAVKGPELFSKWVGESEKAVRSIFAKARANSPAIIFFDEIDGLAVTRGAENDGSSVADRVLSQLLVEMDGLDQRFGVTVIAATNRPDKIDLALLRPGRFDRILDVQPPDELDREDIFRIHTHSMPCSPCVSMKELASHTKGYTGADIRLVCREAAVAALEENLEISEVSMEHFRIGIERVHPSEFVFYQKLAEKFRRFVHGGSALAE